MTHTPTPGQVATWTDSRSLAGTDALTLVGPSGIGVNVNSLVGAPFVTDGVTSNSAQFQSLAPVLQSVGTSMPVPVNFTVGGPTVLSLNPTVPSGGGLPNPCNHFLKPNQAFFFTGTLGSIIGVSLNTLYYVTSANLTGMTFTFSATNNYGPQIGEGTTVITTGSVGSAALSVVFTGQNVNLFFPPGPYFNGNSGSATPNLNITPNGISRIRYFAYGAVFDTKTSFGAVGGPAGQTISDAADWSLKYDLVNTTPNQNAVASLNAIVVLQATANATYWVGQLVSFFSLDIQDPLGTVTSGPANDQYQEYKRIISIVNNSGILTITFDGPLKWSYLSTYPNLANTATAIGGGCAIIAPMHPVFDTEIEIHGAQFIGQTTFTAGKRVLFNDCIYQGFGNAPGLAVAGQSLQYIFRNCRFGPGINNDLMQVDKMMQYLEFDRCESLNQLVIAFESPSLQVCLMKNHVGASILGTPRQIRVVDSNLQNIGIGTLLGVSESAQIYSSRIQFFDMQARSDDNIDPTGIPTISPTNDMMLMPNWTFSGGTFSRNLAGLPGAQNLALFAPGAKYYMTEAGGQTYKWFQNMGGAFAIPNEYMSGTTVSFDTSLSAVPTRQVSSTVSISAASPAVVSSWTGGTLAAGTPVCFTTTQVTATVTMTSANPGVVTWGGGSPTAHGLSPGAAVWFTTTGALPTLINHFLIYFVTNDVHYTSTTFSVSTTLAGALAGTGQVNTTSGTQSGVQTAYADGMPIGTRFSTMYYVSSSPAPTSTTFSVSDTKAHGIAGTNLINTSGLQQGTHTAFANALCFRPHPCPRFTSIGNSGAASIVSLNGAVDEPLFSRTKWGFVGKQSNLGGNSIGFQQPNPRLWGYLKTMNVVVRKAGTASGTLTISSPGFTQPNLALSTFSQVIDTTVAGVRSWTGSAAPTGSAGADSISAYADWIAGPLTFTWSTGVTLPNSPEVELEITTDQGITRYSAMYGAPGTPASNSFLWEWVDAGLQQTFGAIP